VGCELAIRYSSMITSGFSGTHTSNDVDGRRQGRGRQPATVMPTEAEEPDGADMDQSARQRTGRVTPKMHPVGEGEGGGDGTLIVQQ
jgi:hypothetical protein